MDLVVFDLDQTLLAGDSDYLWGQFLVQRGCVDAEQYEQANRQFYDDYLAGNLNIHAFCRFSFKPLVDLPRQRLLTLREQFVDQCIAPTITAAARALLARHRTSGDHLVITTATNRFVTEPIASLLGVDTLLATEPEQCGGRFTGAIRGMPNFREGKVLNLRTWLAGQPPHFASITAYSDSHNDLPLLEMADRAVAVDPDDSLRATALRRGWPIVSLRDPDAGTQSD